MAKNSKSIQLDTNSCTLSRMLNFRKHLLTKVQGRRNDVKARVADFRERALLN